MGLEEHELRMWVRGVGGGRASRRQFIRIMLGLGLAGPLIAEVLAMVERIGAGYYEAELHRLNGELLLMQGGGKRQCDAEASFHRAIELARRRSAKSFELRAVTSLCRLWQRQSRHAEARRCLRETYDWFTEGFDTADLREANALLEGLS